MARAPSTQENVKWGPETEPYATVRRKPCVLQAGQGASKGLSRNFQGLSAILANFPGTEL